MDNTNTALKIEAQETESDEGSILSDEYRKLSEKCDVVIAKIKSRKNRQGDKRASK